MCLMRALLFRLPDCCFCNDCGHLCQANRVSAAEAGKASDKEGGEEGQSEAWP